MVGGQCSIMDRDKLSNLLKKDRRSVKLIADLLTWHCRHDKLKSSLDMMENAICTNCQTTLLKLEKLMKKQS